MYNVEFCSSTFGSHNQYYNARGVWYSVVGNGEAIDASLCASGAGGDSVMQVWTGDCSNLECVSSNDNYCGLYSRVIFNTQVGEIYYIFICKLMRSSNAIVAIATNGSHAHRWILRVDFSV